MIGLWEGERCHCTPSLVVVIPNISGLSPVADVPQRQLSDIKRFAVVALKPGLFLSLRARQVNDDRERGYVSGIAISLFCIRDPPHQPGLLSELQWRWENLVIQALGSERASNVLAAATRQ